MSDARRPRGRRRGRRSAAASGEAASETSGPRVPAGEAPTAGRRRRSAPAVTDDLGRELVPRPSKVRYVLLFFAGVFVGRVATQTFTPDLLSLFNLVTFAALAFGVAWTWRNWARNAMIRRHLEAQRRAAGRRQRPRPADGPDTKRAAEPE